MKAFILTLIFLIVILANVQAQDTIAISKKRIRFLAVGSAVTYTGAMIGLNSTWYSQYDRQSFHFFNDAAEWKQMDKIGHLYSSFQIASGSSRVLRWAGLTEKKSDRIAALTSFGVMASIELLDGFSAGYGASASDLLYNASGIGLYWGQKLVWREIRIHPKLSFHKSDYAALRPNVLGATLAGQILKDYNGETQWLSLDLDKFSDRIPKWLNLAIGYGAEEMIYARDYQNHNAGLFPYRQFYLALDFDTTAIHSKSKAINTLLYVLNMVKLPAPTLELSNKKIRGHYFYF
jgi:hypothetical protein